MGDASRTINQMEEFNPKTRTQERVTSIRAANLGSKFFGHKMNVLARQAIPSKQIDNALRTREGQIGSEI
jgi:hypothetical protein